MAMLVSMLRSSFHLRARAEANSLLALRVAESMKNLGVVVRLAVVVLISILISHIHAEPV